MHHTDDLNLNARAPRLPVAGYLNYPGDHRGHIVGEVKGPNAFGEYVTAVTAEYDPATDLTRVGFAYATVDEVAAAGLETR